MAKHAKHSDEDIEAFDDELVADEFVESAGEDEVLSASHGRRARSEQAAKPAKRSADQEKTEFVAQGGDSKRARHAKRQHAATVLSPTLCGMVTEGARGTVSIADAQALMDAKKQALQDDEPVEEQPVAAEPAEGEVFSWPPAEPAEGEVFSWPPAEPAEFAPSAEPVEGEVFSWPPTETEELVELEEPATPVRAGARTGKRNVIEDRLRAQAALDDPRIFAGLTPTGTGCPDPDDPDAVARARAKRRAQNDHRGEVVPTSAKQIFQENWKNMLLVALIVVIFVVVIVAARAITSSFSQSSATQTETTYVSPYNWTNLDRTNGRFRYIVDGRQLSRLGVDVSENQFDIDWNAVKSDGIDFAMIRLGYRGATQGGLYTDSYYQVNIDGARNAGLDVGVYFFSQATTTAEAVEEANYVISMLGGRTLQYPVAFDSEVVNNGRTADLSRDEMNDICTAFCETIERAGYRSIVYGNSNDLSRYYKDSLVERGIWWAEYNMPSPTAMVDILMWQYSNGGQVAGISTAVDLSIDMTQAYNEAKSN